MSDATPSGGTVCSATRPRQGLRLDTIRRQDKFGIWYSEQGNASAGIGSLYEPVEQHHDADHREDDEEPPATAADAVPASHQLLQARQEEGGRDEAPHRTTERHGRRTGEERE